MKYQVLFSLKNNEKLFVNAVCCSRDWRFKAGLIVRCAASLSLYFQLFMIIFGSSICFYSEM